MTLDEKIGQLIVAGTPGHYAAADAEEMIQIRSLVRDRHIGGIILWQSDVYEAAAMLNGLQAEAKVPLLVSGDFERGAAMRVRRATVIPDAMAIAATRDPDLAYRAGYITALEARAIGVHQNFAPVADINTNPQNPVINTRAFSDNGWLVGVMVNAYVRGTADGGGIATVKHFPGHGDTRIDSHLDLPVIQLDRPRLDSMELAPFRAAIEAGVKSIMIGHLAVPAVGGMPGVPTSLLPQAIDTLLRKDLGFGGLVVTDALRMRGVANGFSTGLSAVMAVKAGADLMLMPGDEVNAHEAIKRAVRSGEIPEERVDQSVRRILGVKRWLELDRRASVELDSIPVKVATREHRALARDIARRAITLLKDEQAFIPLMDSTEGRVSVIILADSEDGRSDINRPGPRSTTELPGAYFVQEFRRRIGSVHVRRLSPSSSRADFESALSAAKASRRIVLTVSLSVRGEDGQSGMRDHIEDFIAALADLQTPVAAVLFGNPYALPAFDAIPAILCAYGESEPLEEAAVEALVGEIPIGGKLPVRISGEYPFGSGQMLQQSTLRRVEGASGELKAGTFQAVDSLLRAAIADSAFPAAQVAVVHKGIQVYDRAFGTHTYAPSSRDIDRATMFDLASLSKVVGTTTALMKLFDQGQVGLDDPVSRYLPPFAEGEKAAITVRHLLMHRGGFPPFRRFWMSDSSASFDSVFATPLVARPGDSTIYSDIGFITLGKVVEAASGMPIDTFLRKEIFEPLGLRNTMYNPPETLLPRVAPTEVDTSWRRTLVHGVVHDENAHFLGGVAGHAGLFSTARDLAVLMTMLMKEGTYGTRQFLSPATVRLFTRDPAPGMRLLGWDVKSPRGSSAGTLFGPSSFGHTGFTGTSIWVDPERELCVIFLTNRVHPTRSNTKISGVRPALHDAVVRAIESHQVTGAI
jgi:beta-glucosidase-like glycosyl hydrolase/CubicO group peptidase (beta-lactamase class C family)